MKVLLKACGAKIAATDKVRRSMYILLSLSHTSHLIFCFCYRGGGGGELPLSFVDMQVIRCSFRRRPFP